MTGRTRPPHDTFVSFLYGQLQNHVPLVAVPSSFRSPAEDSFRQRMT